MGCASLFLKKNISPQKQTKKVFKSIRDVPSAFNNVSTATDYNFKATELKVIPQYCIANPYLRTIFASLAPANERVHVHNKRNFPQAKFDNEMFLFF